jgi:hypothetical protein
MGKEAKTIDQLLDECRDLVNGPLLSPEIRADKAAFNQMCSALDTVGDTVRGTIGYLSTKDHSTENLYLVTYGILQILFVQQDAVAHLAESFGIKVDLKTLPKLDAIRNTRARTIGHPTKRDEGRGKKKSDKVFSYNFISRHSLRPGGFKLMSVSSSSGNSTFIDIDLLKLIEMQDAEVRKILRGIIISLKERIKKSKMKYSEKTLSSHLSNLSYDFEKLSEDIDQRSVLRLGDAALANIRQAIKNFEADLKDRKLDTDGAIDYSLERISRIVLQLESFLKKEKEALAQEDAVIFIDALHSQIETLMQCANELDAEFSTKPKKRVRARKIVLVDDIAELSKRLGVS